MPTYKFKTREWLIDEATKASKKGGIAKSMGTNSPHALKSFAAAVNEAELQEAEKARKDAQPLFKVDPQVQKSLMQQRAEAEMAAMQQREIETFEQMRESARAKKALKFKGRVEKLVRHLDGEMRNKEAARILGDMMKAGHIEPLTEDEIWGLEAMRSLGDEYPGSIYDKTTKTSREALRQQRYELYHGEPVEGPGGGQYDPISGEQIPTGPGIADDPNDARNWSREEYEAYQNREIAPE